MLATLESKLIALGAVLTLIFASLFCFAIHERHVVEARYKKSAIEAKDNSDNQTKQLAADKTKAQQDAQDAQKKYDDYVANNPLGPIRLQYITTSNPTTTQNTSGIESSTSPAAGPGTCGQVSQGSTSETGDISPELGTIMQSFARLSIIDTERKQQYDDLVSTLTEKH